MLNHLMIVALTVFAPAAIAQSLPSGMSAHEDMTFDLPTRQHHDIRLFDTDRSAGIDDLQFGVWDDACDLAGDTWAKVEDEAEDAWEEGTEVIEDLGDQASEKLNAAGEALGDAWNALVDEVEAFCDDPSAWTQAQLEAALEALEELAESADELLESIQAEYEAFRDSPAEWLEDHTDALEVWFGDSLDEVKKFFTATGVYFAAKADAYADNIGATLKEDTANSGAGLAAGMAEIASLGFFDFSHALEHAEVVDTSTVEYRVAEVCGSVIGGTIIIKATLGIGSTKIGQHLFKRFITDGRLGKVHEAIKSWLQKFKARKVVDRTDHLDMDPAEGRKLLRTTLGSKVGEQAHHVVPLQHRTHDLVKRAARGGFDIHGKDNGISLSDKIHRGSHSKYNQRIKEALDDKLEDAAGMTDREVAEWMRKLTKTEKKALSKRDTRLD